MGYFSNLAITVSYQEMWQNRYTSSYFGPCEQLQMRLSDLLDRFDELNSLGSTQIKNPKPESFGEDLQYVLPEDMDHLFDVIAAIEIARRQLRNKYGINAEVGSEESAVRIACYERSSVWRKSIAAIEDALAAA